MKQTDIYVLRGRAAPRLKNSPPGKMHPLVVAAFRNANIDPSSISSSHPPTSPDGTTKYFTKTSRNTPQLIGEHLSLQALSQTAPPGFVPRSFGIAKKGSEGGMVSEYFDLGGPKNQKELGKRLAEVHRYEEPKGRYGFEVPTFCGVTEQDNTWTEGWKEFFTERRLGNMVKRIGDSEISAEWARLKEK